MFRITEENHFYIVKPLAMRVLVVASVNTRIGDWSAYIDAVKGILHKREWQRVANYGEKISKEMAELLFPNCKTFLWRD